MDNHTGKKLYSGIFTEKWTGHFTNTHTRTPPPQKKEKKRKERKKKKIRESSVECVQ